MASRIEDISGLIKSSAWPLIAIVGLILFFNPIQDILKTISNNVDDVKLGGLELHVNQRDLPPVSPEVANAIIGLNEREVVVLMKIVPGTGGFFVKCAGPVDFQTEALDPLTDLEKRNLVTFQSKDLKGSSCPSELDAQLTDTGNSARSFMVNLITAQLKSASATQSAPK